MVSEYNEGNRASRPGKYDKYIWYTFKTYLTSINEEFNEAIKDVNRQCTQDLLSNNYSLTDLMATTSKTFNNIVADGGWILAERNSSASKNDKDSTEDRFMTLPTQIKALTRGDNGRNTMETGTNHGPT